MNAGLKNSNQTNKSKWGAHLPRTFNQEEEAKVIEFLNDLRLAELKLLFLQRYMAYDLESLLRWLRAKKYTSWKTSKGKLLGLNHIGTLDTSTKITLNLFNTTDKNNGNLHIVRLDDNTWAIHNDNIRGWLESMVERNLYPNGAATSVYERFVKGKKNIGNDQDEGFIASFERARGKAKALSGPYTQQYKDWVEGVGEPTIELLREISKEFKTLKFNRPVKRA